MATRPESACDWRQQYTKDDPDPLPEIPEVHREHHWTDSTFTGKTRDGIAPIAKYLPVGPPIFKVVIQPSV